MKLRQLILAFFVSMILTFNIVAQIEQPKTIPISPADKQLIADTFMDIMVLSINLTSEQDQLNALLRPYCDCTDEEFETWRKNLHNSSAGSSFPIKAPKKHTAKFKKDIVSIENLNSLIKSKTDLLETTFSYLESVIRLAFVKNAPYQAMIGDYRIDLKNNQFVRLPDDEKRVTLRQAINRCAFEIAEDLKAQAKAILEKAKQKTTNK